MEKLNLEVVKVYFVYAAEVFSQERAEQVTQLINDGVGLGEALLRIVLRFHPEMSPSFIEDEKERLNERQAEFRISEVPTFIFDPNLYEEISLWLFLIAATELDEDKFWPQGFGCQQILENVFRVVGPKDSHQKMLKEVVLEVYSQLDQGTKGGIKETIEMTPFFRFPFSKEH